MSNTDFVDVPAPEPTTTPPPPMPADDGQETPATPAPPMTQTAVPDNPFMERISGLRQQGYGWDQINTYVATKIKALKDTGYTDQQIGAYTGLNNGDLSTFDTMAKAYASKVADDTNSGDVPNALSPEGFTEIALNALATQSSVGGVASLAMGSKAQTFDPQKVGFAGRIAQMLGMTAPTAAAMGEGASVGAGVGAVAGLGIGDEITVPVGAGIGALGGFILDQFTRNTVADIKINGGMSNSDAAIRLATNLGSAAKESLPVAAALAVAGPVGAGMEAAGAGKIVSALGSGAAQIGAMATVSTAISGKLPTFEDIIDNAILLGAAHGGRVGVKAVHDALWHNWAATGESPASVAQRAAADPSIVQVHEPTAEQTAQGAKPLASIRPVPVPPEAPAEPPTVHIPTEVPNRPLEDQLNWVSTNAQADQLAMRQIVQTAPKGMALPPAEGAYATNDEAIYHHIESPDANPLDPVQQRLHDDFVKPLLEARDKLREAWLKTNPAEADKAIHDPNFVHRVPLNAGATPERLGGVESANPALRGAGGRGLGANPKSARTPTYFTLADSDGNRHVVSEPKFGRYTVHNNGEAAELPGAALDTEGNPASLSDAKTFTDTSGREYNVQRSKTKELEQHTITRYAKSITASLAEEITGYQRAIRNDMVTDAVMKSDNFLENAVKLKGNQTPDTLPKGWAEVPIGKLKGWYLSPELAEPLNDFLKGGPRAFEGPIADRIATINKIAVGSMFALPTGTFAHIRNLLGMGFVGRGWDNLNMLRGARTGFKAMHQVGTLGPDYMEFLRRGGNNLSSSIGNDPLVRFVMNKMGQDIAKDPVRYGPVIKALGLNNATDLGKMITNAQSKFLYGVGDLLNMQRYYELQERGRSKDEAMDELFKFLPSYRMTSRVLGSRALAQAMGDINIMSFGRFNLAKWTAMSHVFKDVAERGATPGQRFDALGRMVTAGFLLTAGSYVMNNLVKYATGNRFSFFRWGSYLNLLQSGVDLAQHPDLGRAWHLFQQAFTPAVGSWEALQLFTNRDFFTGDQIMTGGLQTNVKEEVGHAAKTFASPVPGLATDWQKYIGESLGVSSPSAGALYYQQHSGQTQMRRKGRTIWSQQP